MRFLFRLDLSLHAGAEIFFGILNFVTKHGLYVRRSVWDPVSDTNTRDEEYN